MMITLQCVSRQSNFKRGLVRETFVTTPISINTNSIISVTPSATQDIREVNGKTSDNYHFTEVVYSVGQSVAKIIVLGEYTQVVKSVSDTRVLLNG